MQLNAGHLVRGKKRPEKPPREQVVIIYKGLPYEVKRCEDKNISYIVVKKKKIILKPSEIKF